MNISQTVAKNVKRLLKKDKQSIGDFEKHLGLTKGYFSRHANGKGTIALDIVYRVAVELHVPIEELCKEHREKA